MESFEHMGDWWLPEAPENKISGKLSFDPATGMSLELLGHIYQLLGHLEGEELTEYLNRNEIDIIQGVTEKSFVTLQGCNFTGSHDNFVGLDKTTIEARYVFRGHLFDSINDIKFENISLSYTHLDQWFAHRFFEHQRDGDYTFKFDNLSCVPFEPVETLLGKNLVLRFDFVPNGELSDIEISLKYGARITIQPKEPSSWFNQSDDGYRRLINFHLPNFLILATGYVNYPFNISGTVADSESPVSIHYPTLAHLHKPPKVGWPSMFFTFSDAKDNLSKYLYNWINKSDKLLVIYDRYFKSYHEAIVDYESQFLDLAQALEGYHRRLCGGTYLSEADYAPTYTTLVNAIPKNVDRPHRDKLVEMLKYGYEYSLRKRLKLICKNILGDYQDIVGELVGDLDTFIGTVVDTRDDLTHILEKPGENAIRDDFEKMYEYVKKMQFLLRMCFLVELGFSPNEIKQLLNKDLKYRQFIDSVAERAQNHDDTRD